VEARRRNQRGEAVDQLQRLERHVRGPVSPTMAELVQQAAVRQLAQAFRCHGRPTDVATQSLQALPVVGGDRDAGVQAEAVAACEAGRLIMGLHLVGLDLHSIPEAQHALACAGTRRDPALDRGGEQLRKQGIVFDELVGLVSESASFDDADDAANHALEDPLQLSGLRRGSEVEPKGRVALRGTVGPVEDQGVEVDVEVERPAESLDEGDRTAQGRAGAGALGSGSIPSASIARAASDGGPQPPPSARIP
jgi:hypothetical protein